MTTVRQLLEGKGYEAASIEPDKSVYDAMQLMAAQNIGALLAASVWGVSPTSKPLSMGNRMGVQGSKYTGAKDGPETLWAASPNCGATLV